jgi:hypothetical protein
VVCPIETKLHHVVSLGSCVGLAARLGPNMILALLVCTLHLTLLKVEP